MSPAAARVVAEDWNARHEPAFESTWLTHLLSRFGEWCRASDVWEPGDAYQRAVLRQRAWEAVCGARRLGIVIDSCPRRGYRVIGHAGLPRYVHLHERAEDREGAQPPGQLTLAECAGVE